MIKPKDRFIKLLEGAISEIESIDNDTEWSVVEPTWWLMMNDLQRELIDCRESLKRKVCIDYHGDVGAREVFPRNGTIGEIIGKGENHDYKVKFDRPFVCTDGYDWEIDEYNPDRNHFIIELDVSEIKFV